MVTDMAMEVAGIINHFWLATISDPKPMKDAHLKYISHNWDGRPYWYIWFTDCPGVYRLEIITAYPENGYDWVSECAVKYYPKTTEEWFNGLSIMEQLCRMGEMFYNHPTSGGCSLHHEHEDIQCNAFPDLADETGVPNMASYSTIPVDFFFAGTLVLAYKANTGSTIRIKSQDTWKVILTQDYYLSNQDNKQYKVLRRGETDRDYPGYAITDLFARHFLSAWVQFHKYPTRKESIWKGTGTIFLTDGDTLNMKKSEDVTLIISQTEVFFGQEQLPWLIDDSMMQAQTTMKERESAV